MMMMMAWLVLNSGGDRGDVEWICAVNSTIPNNSMQIYTVMCCAVDK